MRKFVKVLEVVSVLLAVASLIAVLYFTQQCEAGGSIKAYLIRVIPAMCAFGASIAFNNSLPKK